MALWYPAAAVMKATRAGLSFDGAPYRGVLHTTEGKTAAGSFAVYRSQGYWPHFTATYETARFRIWQHLPLNVGGYALVNVSGGVETNRQNAIQIELVGSANIANRSWGPQYVENFPPGYLAGIARWMRWVEAQTGIKRTAPKLWKPYPASYGQRNGVRLSAGAWRRFNGWLGHQHVPENCVSPDTPILCADPGWRSAGDLRVGDRVVAFDEEGGGARWHAPGSGRRFRTASVVRNDPGRKPCAVVRTAKAEVVASVDHPWLVRRPAGPRGRARYAWIATTELRQGDLLAWFAEPWETERSSGAGWLAGLLDADGWLRATGASNGACLGIGQLDGATRERVIDEFRSRGFTPTVVHREAREGRRSTSFAQISIRGLRDHMRCLGTIRPRRLMDTDLAVLWEGRKVRNNASADPVEVWQVEPVGDAEVASITARR
ncbi:MAG TPA: Hint domain-containing protein [Actinomycetes bacterium]|jgi:hypothetical protein|nr:Hint domain-containing protein [Actinomycetes bacterium]